MRKTEIIRCKAAVINNPLYNTREEPKEENASILAGDSNCAVILLDGEEKVRVLDWHWISFLNKNTLRITSRR